MRRGYFPLEAGSLNTAHYFNEFWCQFCLFFAKVQYLLMLLFIKGVNGFCLVLYESVAAELIKWFPFHLLRAPVSTSRLDLHLEAVHTDLGVGCSIWHGWQVWPDLQRGVPAVRGKAVRAMWVERWLRPSAGWPDGEDGNSGQSPPKHQLHIHCGGFERRIGAAAQ